MSGKMKILLAVLALGALISVSYIFSSLGSPETRSQTAAGLDAIANDPCQTDGDQDGLPDCEETYWKTDFKNPDTDGDGFKDGEEVLSSRDPIVKGPDDYLDKRGNVTNQAATLLLGAVAVGDLLTDSPKYHEAVDKYSEAIIGRYQANSQIPEEAVIIGGDRRVDILKYSLAALHVIGPALDSLSEGFVAVIATVPNTTLDDLSTLRTTNPGLYTSFISEIDRQMTALNAPIATLRAMPVPQPLVDGHTNILTLLRGVQQQYRLLHQIVQDPVQGLLALQSLATMTRSTSVDVIQDFALRLDNALQRP